MKSAISKPIDAVVAGYLGVDLTPGFAPTRTVVPFTELFRPGKLIETEGLHVSLGGVVANTGLAIRQFGQRVELMGCVGNDALGDMALARLAQVGVSRGIRRNSQSRDSWNGRIWPVWSRNWRIRYEQDQGWVCGVWRSQYPA